MDEKEKKEIYVPVPKVDIATVKSENNEQLKKMYQGNATNKLSVVNTRKMVIDDITGSATIEDNGIKIFFENHNKLKASLRVSTQKLLDMSIIYLTANNNYRETDIQKINTDVAIPLKEYAKFLGRDLSLKLGENSTVEEIEKEKKRVNKIIDKVREKVKEDLETLFSMSLSWTEPKVGKKGSSKDFMNIRVLQSSGIKNGVIHLRFTQEIAQYLNHSYITNFPTKLLTVDERNPLIYQLGHKLALHSNIENNIKKGTQNIIGVKTLLEKIGEIRKIKEIIEKDRGHWGDRIKNPLEKALDTLKDKEILKYWEYSNSKGVPLKDSQIEISSYEVFESLYIHFELNK